MNTEYLIDNITQYSNDLFAEISCIGCAEKNKAYKLLKFTGYNDHYFFHVVNKDFREMTCDDCNTKWLFKWTYDGVVLKRQ